MNLTTLEVTLTAGVLGMLGVIVGKVIFANGRISEKACNQLRSACLDKVELRLQNIEEKLEEQGRSITDLTKSVLAHMAAETERERIIRERYGNVK
jgi:enamine deaminase RidA (YjgF/YER057c/UK114 family)